MALKKGAMAVVALATLLAMHAQQAPAEAPSGREFGRRAADSESLAVERDILARARAEREATIDRVIPPRPGPAAAAPSEEDGNRIRDEAIEEEVARRVRAAENDAELDRLSEMIRRRGAAPPGASPPAFRADPGNAATARVAVPEGPVQVTVLLRMVPGTTGIRRFTGSTDPVLCIGETCWISRGPEADAERQSRRVALGPVNTLGRRAGACNDSLGCVFRNVTLPERSAVVQPVDLRLLRHDRREARVVAVDTSCRAAAQGLTCAQPQDTAGYRLWVVEEDVAGEAGWRALAAMVGIERSWWDRRLR